MSEESTALVALNERNLQLMSDYDRQRELFAKFGYPNPGPYLMGHNAVIETEDGKYKLVTREHPVDFSMDIEGNIRCIRAMEKTTAEKLGGMRIESHPNPDTAKALVDNVLCQSIEVGEVASWGEF